MAADPSSARVWIAEGGEAGRPVALAEGRTVFGRADSCEVTLDDEAVSTDHLEISVRGGSLLATDLDSRNGTKLNGNPLDRPRRLRNGDVLQIGPYRLEVALPPQIRHESTVTTAGEVTKLTADEREVRAPDPGQPCAARPAPGSR